MLKTIYYLIQWQLLYTLTTHTALLYYSYLSHYRLFLYITICFILFITTNIWGLAIFTLTSITRPSIPNITYCHVYAWLTLNLSLRTDFLIQKTQDTTVVPDIRVSGWTMIRLAVSVTWHVLSALNCPMMCTISPSRTWQSILEHVNVNLSIHIEII